MPCFKFNNSDYDKHFNKLITLSMLQRMGSLSIQSSCLLYLDPEKKCFYPLTFGGNMVASSCVLFSDLQIYNIFCYYKTRSQSHNDVLHLSELRCNHVCNSYLIFWICILYAIAYSVYKCCIIFYNNNYYYYLIPYIHVIWYFFSVIPKAVHHVEMLTCQ